MRHSQKHLKVISFCVLAAVGGISAATALAQMIDQTRAPNAAHAGILKSLAQEIGTGRGNWMTPDSSSFIIARDPFRAIRRGRQLFQRKFTRAQGQGPNFGDGAGNIGTDIAIGAGLADSCAACHGRPRGAAGSGGDVVTRPDSRDAPHLFGLGLKEMLADEITSDLRSLRDRALKDSQKLQRPVTVQLVSKGIHYGALQAQPDGSVDTSHVEGVDPDLRVRPFFSHGGTISIREFVVGALKNEMGLESVDPDLASAAAGGRITTPSGMVLDGKADKVESPPTADASADPDGDGVVNEIPASLVDYLEFYLLNYFKPGLYQQTSFTQQGRQMFSNVGCAVCHIPDLQINHDRRVADVETTYNADQGNLNQLFAIAMPLVTPVDDGSGFPFWRRPNMQGFLVRNIFADLKRHDLGPNFYERNYDGTLRTEFMTTALWGVGSTAPYGHDGRSINLREVILRHGGEAQNARNAFADLQVRDQEALIAFLHSLVLFPPDDTASNLDPGDRSTLGFPQFGHGSIKLTVLFNNPADGE